MKTDERRAADELDRLLSSLQGRRPAEPAQAVDRQDARLAARLVQLSKITRLEPATAVRFEALLKQTRPWEPRAGAGRWRTALKHLAVVVRVFQVPARRPLLVALMTLLLAVASFAVFSRLSAPAAIAPLATVAANPLPPVRPRAFGEFAPALLSFLNAQPGNAAALKPLLTAWGALAPTPPLSVTWEAVGDVVSADIDRNGEDDLLIALPNPDDPAADGTFMLFLKQAGAYRLAEETRYQSRPRILYVQDMLGDGRLAIVRTTSQCTANNCSVGVDVLRWQNDRLRSLMAATVRMDYPEISIGDGTQGAKELALHGGANPAAGAGPQRAYTAVYRWNGAAFAVAETRLDNSSHLYFKVVDANLLMLQGKYGEAAALYQEATSNGRLQTWDGHDGAQERADLQAFSRFRAMVAYSLLGSDAKAQQWRDYVLNEQGSHIYARVVSLYWQGYAPNRSVAEGCGVVTAFAASTPAVAAVLDHFGFANPGFTPQEVCPFK